jgi:Tol biopolymer transport system component
VSAAPFDGPSWSADGSRLAFAGGGGTEHIYVIDSGGGKPTLLPHTKNASRPVMAPDGQAVAFARVRVRGADASQVAKARGRARARRAGFLGASVWLLDLRSGRSRRLTPWRNGLFSMPSSFSPDGTTLAMSREVPRKPPEAIALDVASGARSLIAANASEPVYSPQGSRVAFVRPRKPPGKAAGPSLFPGSDVYVTDGSTVSRLTRTPGRAEFWPRWDPSGERLVFTQFASKLSFAALFGISNAVIEINADGTCRHRLLFERQAAFYGAAWQPGPGREVGRISC